MITNFFFVGVATAADGVEKLGKAGVSVVVFGGRSMAMLIALLVIVADRTENGVLARWKGMVLMHVFVKSFYLVLVSKDRESIGYIFLVN